MYLNFSLLDYINRNELKEPKEEISNVIKQASYEEAFGNTFNDEEDVPF